MSLFLRRYFRNFLKLDPVLLALTLLLTAIGIYYIYGIGQVVGGTLKAYWYKQIVWFAVGFLLMNLIAMIDTEILGKSSWLLYLVGLGLLLLVLVVGIKINGQRSWISVPGATIQPSELAKPLTLLPLAWLATRARVQLDEFRSVPQVLILAIIPMSLIMLQPDMGSTIVFIPLLTAVLFFSGIKKRYLVYPLVAALITAPVLYSALKPHQKKRIDVFLHPVVHPYAVDKAQAMAKENLLPQEKIDRAAEMRDPVFYIKTEIAHRDGLIKDEQYRIITNPRKAYNRGLIDKETYRKYWREELRGYVTLRQFIQEDSWQSYQSLLAVGSGGFWGKGWMNGTQHTLGFLPTNVSPTDCIISVISEEAGFYKTAGLIFLELLLFLRIIQVAAHSSSNFGRVLCLGTACMFLFHTYINIGMAIGIAPIIGIPLPFVSYGGSFMLSTMIFMGLVQGVAQRRKQFRSLGNVE